MVDDKTLEVLKDDSIAIELRTLLLQHELDTASAQREIENSQFQRIEDARFKRLEFWHNTPLVVALVGVITIAANGAVNWIQSDQSATAAASQTERQFSYDIITSELSKTSDQKERANVLLFLTEVGVLDDLNREALTTISLNSGGAEGATIPPTIGTFVAPSYDVPMPSDVAGQTAAANALLKIAVEELNSDIDEFNRREEIDKYWSVVPSARDLNEGDRTLWSSAFISWAVERAGNPDQIELSAAHHKMWQSALVEKITILPPALPLPGDIAFFARSATGEVARKDGVWTGIAGIVNEVNASSIKMITGNSGEGLRLVDRRLDDPRLVGYVRLDKSSL